MKTFKTLLTLFLLFNNSFAADDDFQIWGQFYWQGPMANKIRGYLEVQNRYSISDYQQTEAVMIRPGIFYVLNPSFSFAAGYLWAPVLAPKFTDENRYWQQAVFNHVFESLTTLFRFRFEQRDVAGIPNMAYRARLQIRGQYDLQGDGDWWAVVWDEYFYNFNHSGNSIKQGFNQNRFFIGLNHRIHPQIRLEFGAMNLYVNRIGSEDRLINGAIFAAFTTF